METGVDGGRGKCSKRFPISGGCCADVAATGAAGFVDYFPFLGKGMQVLVSLAVDPQVGGLIQGAQPIDIFAKVRTKLIGMVGLE